jgi:hypothetical protein
VKVDYTKFVKLSTIWIDLSEHHVLGSFPNLEEVLFDRYKLKRFKPKDIYLHKNMTFAETISNFQILADILPEKLALGNVCSRYDSKCSSTEYKFFPKTTIRCTPSLDNII